LLNIIEHKNSRHENSFLTCSLFLYCWRRKFWTALLHSWRSDYYSRTDYFTFSA